MIILILNNTDIRIMAFTSEEAEAYGRWDEIPAAKFRVFVNSAPARHRIKPLDVFASDEFGHFSEASQGSALDADCMEPDGEVASISTLHFSSRSDHVAGDPATTSFFGLIAEDDGETTMVIPETPYTLDGVTNASCEILARSLGWHIERRAVSCVIPDHGERRLAHTITLGWTSRACQFL